MCGLVGIYGNCSVKDNQVFEDLLIVDTIRGMDSTGALFVDHTTGNYLVTKKAGTPQRIMRLPEYKREWFFKHLLLMGHNRAASVGNIDDASAHPFEFDGLIGAHNGTLINYHDLDEGRKYQVDSQKLFSHMDEHGLKDTVKKLYGALALTWYEHEDMSINFLRNSDRPLYYCVSKEGDKLYWASEKWMLVGVLGRHKVEYKTIKSLPVNVHHKVIYDADNNELIVSTNGYKFPKLKKQDKTDYRCSNSHLRDSWEEYFREKQQEEEERLLEFCYEDTALKAGDTVEFVIVEECSYMASTPFIVVNLTGDIKATFKIANASKLKDKIGYCYSGVIDRMFDKNYQAASGFSGAINVFTVKEVVYEDCDEPESNEKYLGYDGAELTLDEWEKKVAAGCCWCSSPVFSEEHKDLLWISEDDFLCPHCAELDSVKQYLLC